MEGNTDIFTPGRSYNIAGMGIGVYVRKEPNGYKFRLPGGAMHIEPNKDNISEVSAGVYNRAPGIFSPGAGTGRGGRKSKRRKTRKGKSKRRSISARR